MAEIARDVSCLLSKRRGGGLHHDFEHTVQGIQSIHPTRGDIVKLKRLFAKIRMRKDVSTSPDPSPLSFKELENLLNRTALEIFEKYRWSCL